MVLMELGGLVQRLSQPHFLDEAPKRGLCCAPSPSDLRTQGASKATGQAGKSDPGRLCAPLFPLLTPHPLCGLGKGSSITTLFLPFHPAAIESALRGQGWPTLRAILMKVTECPGS